MLWGRKENCWSNKLVLKSDFSTVDYILFLNHWQICCYVDYQKAFDTVKHVFKSKISDVCAGIYIQFLPLWYRSLLRRKCISNCILYLLSRLEHVLGWATYRPRLRKYSLRRAIIDKEIRFFSIIFTYVCGRHCFISRITRWSPNISEQNAGAPWPKIIALFY